MAKKKKTITPEEPKLFEKFWDKYAMKLDRIAAIKAWNNLDKDLRRAAIAGIQRYRNDCEARGIPRMYAQGYLNHRRWEDEILSPGSSTVESGGTAADKDLFIQEGQVGVAPPDMAIW